MELVNSQMKTCNNFLTEVIAGIDLLWPVKVPPILEVKKKSAFYAALCRGEVNEDKLKYSWWCSVPLTTVRNAWTTFCITTSCWNHPTVRCRFPSVTNTGTACWELFDLLSLRTLSKRLLREDFNPASGRISTVCEWEQGENETWWVVGFYFISQSLI